MLCYVIVIQLFVVVVIMFVLVLVVYKLVVVCDVIILFEYDVVGWLQFIGMGYFIVVGVGVIGDVDGWFILLVDMLLVQFVIILVVVQGLECYLVCYVQYCGIQGYFVGFGIEFFLELMVLQGDEGVRCIVVCYVVQFILVDDFGVYIDVDIVEDFVWFYG